ATGVRPRRRAKPRDRECRGRRHYRRGLDQVRADVAEVRRDLQALTARVDSLAERVARIEGALTGPWRPANGTPASTQGASSAG
ncbi:MAG: hypothetical protein OXJ62_02170, partial [Spirochaetaceae bacterium]|nr:hypothetical protein [Spirochaetaceae bacterium]